MLIYFRKMRLRKMSRNAQGKAWETATANAFKRLVENTKGKFWWHRLFDFKTFIAINPNLVCIKQPADYIACHEGNFYLVENKSSTMPRFRLDNVKPHQEEAMELITTAGGFYWLLIMHRDNDGHEHQAYALTPADWKRVKMFTAKEGCVSASWDTIKRCASFEIQRAHGVWDFEPLFNAKQSTLAKPGMIKLKMRKVFQRSTTFIWAREFPAVALFDGETEEILIVTDIWFCKNVEFWREANKCKGHKCATLDPVSHKVCKVCGYRDSVCFEGVSDQLQKDLSQSQIHELIHWAVPDDCSLYSGLQLKNFEECVDKIAYDLAFRGHTKWAQTFFVKPTGGLKPV